MTSEAARVALYRLGEVTGTEHAETLMSSPPLEPAVKLATKDDIQPLDRRIDEIVVELREMRAEFHRALRTQMLAIIGAMTALTGVFSTIMGLVT